METHRTEDEMVEESRDKWFQMVSEFPKSFLCLFMCFHQKDFESMGTYLQEGNRFFGIVPDEYFYRSKDDRKFILSNIDFSKSRLRNSVNSWKQLDGENPWTFVSHEFLLENGSSAKNYFWPTHTFHMTMG